MSWRRCRGAVLLSLIAWPLAFWIAERSFAADDSQTAISTAYSKTKTAKTTDDYGEILRLCGEAQAGELTAELRKYTEELQAWAYNRRGELYVERAAAAVVDGDALLASELDALALADFERAVERDATRWKPWQNRGLSYGLEGRYDEAIADFARAIELQPDQPDVWFNRAEILLELGRHDEAIRDYDQVLRLAPDDDGALLGRGQARSYLGDADAALEDLDAAIRTNGTRAAPHTARGVLFERLGRWEEAASDHRRAIGLDPQSADAYRCAAWLMATCPEPRFRSDELAVEAGRRAWDLAGRQGWRYLDTLAAAYANAGQFEQAADLAAQAVEAAPSSPSQTKAELARRLREYSQSRPYRQAQPQAAAAP